MNRQHDDRDQRVAEYLRRRGGGHLPATFTDDVVRAAAATPQDGGRVPSWWRTPVLAVATAVLAVAVTLGGLSLIAPPVGDDPTPFPSPSVEVPSASASALPSASPQSTESAEPSPSPTTEPTATPAAIQQGDVLVSVTDNLVVRADAASTQRSTKCNCSRVSCCE